MNKYKKIIIVLIFCILFQNNTFAYKELIIKNIDNKLVRVIKVVLDSEDYVVSSLALTGGNTLENLTKQIGGTTSINGVFFCPDDYSQCKKTNTISDRIFLGEGKKYSRYRGDTGIRGIFGFNKNGEPLFVQKNLGYMTGLNINFNSGKLDDLYFGLGNFPVLLYKGENVLWGSEIEMDNKIKNTGTKQFICSNQNNDTIYMGIIAGINIYELTSFIKKNFKCYNAILLDAGLSTSMIYDNRILQKSKRKNIMDAFVVLNKEQYTKLTHYTPPQKNKYIPKNNYTLTNKDKKGISIFENFLRKKIKINGSDYKRYTIKILRKIISDPKFQDPKVQAKLHELLVRLYTISYL